MGCNSRLDILISSPAASSAIGNHIMKYLLSIFIFSIGTISAQSNCSTYEKDYLPKDLDDALTFLNCTWSKEDKDSFKIEPERQAVVSLHFGTGLVIRNGWDLWKGKSELVDFFNSIGIFHPDDISSIILTSFHRYLNGKEIDLPGQVKYYQDYWYKVQAEKDKHWKLEWKDFYPNRTDQYLLIKVIPDYLEVVNYRLGISGDSKTWQPFRIDFK